MKGKVREVTHYTKRHRLQYKFHFAANKTTTHTHTHTHIPNNTVL